MRKLILVLFVLGVAQWSQASPVDDYDSDEEVERSFWSSALTRFKKAVKVEALACDGPSCSTCLSANYPVLKDQKGCFTITYKDGSINLNLNLAGKTLWQTNFKAGKPVPSCTKIHKPIKEVCLQDFSVNLPNGHGDVCFTLAFKSYQFGVKYCVTINGAHMAPSQHPTIVKV